MTSSELPRRKTTSLPRTSAPPLSTGSSASGKFTIPRRREHRLLQETPDDSRESKDVYRIVRQSYSSRGESSSDTELSFSNVQVVNNTRLQQEYCEWRTEMRNAGYSETDLRTQYCFLAVPSMAEAERLCGKGLECVNQPLVCLGDPKLGVYLDRHANIACEALVLPEGRRSSSSEESKIGFLVIFATTRGRVKTVAPRFAEDDNGSRLEPTPNFDCHISRRVLSTDRWSKESAKDSQSKVYFFEFGDVEMKSRPRQCCPFAVVQISSRNTPSVPRPHRASLTPLPSLPGRSVTSLRRPAQARHDAAVEKPQGQRQLLWSGPLMTQSIRLLDIKLYTSDVNFRMAECGFGNEIVIEGQLKKHKLSNLLPYDCFDDDLTSVHESTKGISFHWLQVHAELAKNPRNSQAHLWAQDCAIVARLSTFVRVYFIANDMPQHKFLRALLVVEENQQKSLETEDRLFFRQLDEVTDDFQVPLSVYAKRCPERGQTGNVQGKNEQPPSSRPKSCLLFDELIGEWCEVAVNHSPGKGDSIQVGAVVEQGKSQPHAHVNNLQESYAKPVQKSSIAIPVSKDVAQVSHCRQVDVNTLEDCEHQDRVTAMCHSLNRQGCALPACQQISTGPRPSNNSQHLPELGSRASPGEDSALPQHAIACGMYGSSSEHDGIQKLRRLHSNKDTLGNGTAVAQGESDMDLESDDDVRLSAQASLSAGSGMTSHTNSSLGNRFAYLWNKFLNSLVIEENAGASDVGRWLTGTCLSQPLAGLLGEVNGYARASGTQLGTNTTVRDRSLETPRLCQSDSTRAMFSSPVAHEQDLEDVLAKHISREESHLLGSDPSNHVQTTSTNEQSPIELPSAKKRRLQPADDETEPVKRPSSETLLAKCSDSFTDDDCLPAEKNKSTSLPQQTDFCTSDQPHSDARHKDFRIFDADNTRRPGLPDSPPKAHLRLVYADVDHEVEPFGVSYRGPLLDDLMDYARVHYEEPTRWREEEPIQQREVNEDLRYRYEERDPKLGCADQFTPVYEHAYDSTEEHRNPSWNNTDQWYEKHGPAHFPDRASHPHAFHPGYHRGSDHGWRSNMEHSSDGEEWHSWVRSGDGRPLNHNGLTRYSSDNQQWWDDDARWRYHNEERAHAVPKSAHAQHSAYGYEDTGHWSAADGRKERSWANDPSERCRHHEALERRAANYEQRKEHEYEHRRRAGWADGRTEHWDSYASKGFRSDRSRSRLHR